MYKYELHCHTAETSRCGQIKAAELVDFYKQQGYDGIIITDHFFNGNTTVPQNLPWDEKVKLFCTGYNNAKKRGDEIGIKVFLGWEFSVMGTDFLTYGLDERWLIENPDCDKLRISKYCDLVHKSGGFIVQAHPFREAGYIEMIRLLPRKCDAVEVINAGRTDFENAMAKQYAENYGLIKTCGTDNHTGYCQHICAMELQTEANSMNDILKAIKENKHTNVVYDL